MPNDVSVKEREPKLFVVVGMVFVAALLISNIAAQKLFAFGALTFTAGIIVFPITYIFGDVLTEVYGYSRTRKVIWTGFGCNIFMVIILWIAVKLPPAEGWPLQEQFAQVLGLIPRIVLASIIGYWAGEFVNSFVMAKMKVLTKGRWLWSRTIASTFAGQFVDTVLFVLIAFIGVFNINLLGATIWWGWLFKVVYEALATPLTYLIVGLLKQYEGIDHYDIGTDFNPFTLRDVKGQRVTEGESS